MHKIDSQNLQLEITPIEAGKRVDQLLAISYIDISRSKIKKLIENGKLYVNNIIIYEADYKVKIGDQIVLHEEETPVACGLQPKNMPLFIVYEDGDLLVIDKPAGLTVHPGAGNYEDTLANGLVHYLSKQLSNIGGSQRPGIVHRLDKDTSGLLLVAKNDMAHAHLSAQLARHEVKREYFALIYGVPHPISGRIETYIGRSQHDRTKMAVQQDRGKLAITNYRVEQVYGDAALSVVTCILETGRTHQIRVHMTNKRHPIVGDQVYGRSYNYNLNSISPIACSLIHSLKRQALHAKTLGFIHPTTGQWIELSSPLPQDISQIVEALTKGE